MGKMGKTAGRARWANAVAPLMESLEDRIHLSLNAPFRLAVATAPNGFVNASWERVPGDTADKIYIYRSDAGGPFTKLAEVASTQNSANYALALRIPDNTIDYAFEVKAVDTSSSEVSDPSNVVMFVSGLTSSLQLTASTDDTPNNPTITLNWQALGGAYTVDRLTNLNNSWSSGQLINGTTATSYVDHAAVPGQAYYYRVVGGGSTAYLSTGVDVAPAASSGSVDLIVESGVASSLASKIATFRQDLAADGWNVIGSRIIDCIKLHIDVVSGSYNPIRQAIAA